MKFKRLALEELKELEPEFITFLASHQITADDWVKIKASQEEKMGELLDQFSDLVYEKVLKKINYLEYLSAKEIRLFHCGEEQINLIGIKVNQENEIDFTNGNILEQINKAANLNTSIFSSEKKYQNDRASEVFQLIESGCFVSDGNLFNLLMKVKK